MKTEMQLTQSTNFPHMKFWETLFLFLHLHHTKDSKPNHQHSRSAMGIGSGFFHMVLSVNFSEEVS